MKKSTMKTVIESLTRELRVAHSTIKADNSYIEELQDRNADLVSRMSDQTDLEDEINWLKRVTGELRQDLVAAKTQRIFSLDELERFLTDDSAPITRIKTIRTITGCGLKEAKDFYEANMRGHFFPSTKPMDIYNAE